MKLVIKNIPIVLLLLFLLITLSSILTQKQYAKSGPYIGMKCDFPGQGPPNNSFSGGPGGNVSQNCAVYEYCASVGTNQDATCVDAPVTCLGGTLYQFTYGDGKKSNGYNCPTGQYCNQSVTNGNPCAPLVPPSSAPSNTPSNGPVNCLTLGSGRATCIYNQTTCGPQFISDSQGDAWCTNFAKSLSKAQTGICCEPTTGNQCPGEGAGICPAPGSPCSGIPGFCEDNNRCINGLQQIEVEKCVNGTWQVPFQQNSSSCYGNPCNLVIPSGSPQGNPYPQSGPYSCPNHLFPGDTCCYSQAGKCYAGTGGTGFNPPTCKYNQPNSNPIACPGQSNTSPTPTPTQSINCGNQISYSFNPPASSGDNCVYSQSGGKCYAGTLDPVSEKACIGKTWFNPPVCHYSQSSNTPVPCPGSNGTSTPTPTPATGACIYSQSPLTANCPKTTKSGHPATACCFQGIGIPGSFNNGCKYNGNNTPVQCP